MPHSIPLPLWFLLMGQLTVLIVSVLQSYFGGFRGVWRASERGSEDAPLRTYGLSSAEIGQMMLWRGEMNHGAISVILLWVVLPALNTGMMNPLGFDILFVAHAAQLGIKLAFLGPLSVAILTIVLDPRLWLGLGFFVLSWDFASWQSQMACFVMPLYGLFLNVCRYPQKVHGIRSRCSHCSEDWNYERYRDAMKCIRDPGQETCFKRCRARFPTYLERERVIVLLLERFGGPQGVRSRYSLSISLQTPMQIAYYWKSWRRRLCAVMCCPGISALLVTCVILSRATKQNWIMSHDDCFRNTGGTCSLFGCDAFRNAICNRSDWETHGHCVCAANFCAVDGMCLPVPSTWGMRTASPVADVGPSKKRALVFSGGGALGAWEVGLLEGLCDVNTAAHAAFPNWTMLVGTSIGALNAGFLAQFPPEEQCSRGLEAMRKYWGAIRDTQDVFESQTSWHFDNFDHASCLRVSEAPAIFDAFATKGGLCDSAPGAASYSFEVDPERIRNSGMKLWVVSTSLNTSSAHWWNDQSPDILEGCLASGALAPLMYPKIHNNEWFIDGGFVANSPVAKAVREGAEEILVILVRPLVVPKFHALPPFGMSIVEFEFNFLMYKLFVESELESACQLGALKGTKIWGYCPVTDKYSMLDFIPARITEMRQDAYKVAARSGPVDLCAWLREARGKDAEFPIHGHAPVHPVAELASWAESDPNAVRAYLAFACLSAFAAGLVQSFFWTWGAAPGRTVYYEGSLRDDPPRVTSAQRPLLQGWAA